MAEVTGENRARNARKASKVGSRLALLCHAYAALFVLLMPMAAAAQDEDRAAANEADPSLSGWQFFQTIEGRDLRAARYLAIDLPPEVFGRARSDLSDLRIADAAGMRVPYARRELRPRHQRDPVRIVRQFDEGKNEAKRYVQVNLELADPGPQGHNDIEVRTRGMNFRRRVQVLAANDATFDDPVVFLDTFLVRYEIEGRVLDLKSLQYPAQRSRFLQVRVYADAQADKDIPTIEAVQIRRLISTPGVYTPWTPAQLEPRQDIRTESGPGSGWFITTAQFPGEPLPWAQLRFRTRDAEVERPFRLQIADPDQPRQDIDGIDWRWQRDQDVRYLVADLPHDFFAGRLRLVITDYANPPLNIEAVEFRIPVRQIIFMPEEKKLHGPLRLYYGNPSAGAPNYDFQNRLPADIKPPPAAFTLGKRESNPAYQPPPPTLHERMPWLIYVALAIASLALLAILAGLARTALREQELP
ncbi:MAG: DUF3999 domain-containing protein [Planctomycetes bacterium]|nr:DUF3999 domain-containing protein [Planctomycetota bacterium]